MNTNGAFNIFKIALDSALPRNIISKSISFNDNILKVKDREYKLNQNLSIVAFGKAVIGMVRAVQDMLTDHIVRGVCSFPYGIIHSLQNSNKIEMLPISDSKIHIFEGAKNNFPDDVSLTASKEILNLLYQLGDEDILLVLISGGGSALLSLPEDPVSLEDLQSMTSLMSLSGASIEQLNSLRKNIEVLKGGGISSISYPAKVIALILSDVIGDNLEFIASGPTVPNNSSPAECICILEDLNIFEQIPNSIRQFLQQRIEVDYHNQNETNDSRISEGRYLNTQNVIIGSNKMAVEAALIYCDENGILPLVLTYEAKGATDGWANIFYLLTKSICANDLGDSELTYEFHKVSIPLEKIVEIGVFMEKKIACSKGICIISAGETTVKVKGSGRGGRNQHLVLQYASQISPWLRHNPQLRSAFRFAFLSCGTDGQDGPTDAAGAFFRF